MAFSSYWFLLAFLPVAFLGHLFLSARGMRQSAILWLLLASLAFYASWGIGLVWPLLASLAFNYLLSGYLVAGSERRRALLYVGVVANIAFLAGFKLAALRHCAETLRCTGGFLGAEDILIPLGISFFTFQQIAFLVDCAKGRCTRPTLTEYGLFILFFPQLVMGPIVHARHVLPQFQSERFLARDARDWAAGVSLLALGLFKKTVLADSLAPYVASTFSRASGGDFLSTIDAWGAAIAFQFQLYFDFSGYADMAVGLALLFGIAIPFSFDSPHKSKNRFEVWRRWNITLVEFFRSYVFLPLVRRGVSPWLALLVTALCSGLWHGIGTTFLVWSLVMAALMLVVHWRKRFLPTIVLIGAWAKGGHALAVILTFCITSLLGVIFRAPDIDTALHLYRAMFSVSNGINLSMLHLLLLAFCTIIIWFMPNTREMFGRCVQGHDDKATTQLAFAPNWRWGIAIGIVGVVALVFTSRSTRFVYLQF